MVVGGWVGVRGCVCVCVLCDLLWLDSDKVGLCGFVSVCVCIWKIISKCVCVCVCGRVRNCVFVL